MTKNSEDSPFAAEHQPLVARAAMYGTARYREFRYPRLPDVHAVETETGEKFSGAHVSAGKEARVFLGREVIAKKMRQNFWNESFSGKKVATFSGTVIAEKIRQNFWNESSSGKKVATFLETKVIAKKMRQNLLERKF